MTRFTYRSDQYLKQQRERARLVWRGVDPASVPPDYQGYYERDQHLAAGPHPGDPTPADVVRQGTKFCIGTPDDCIKFYEAYEAMGVEQVFLLCAIGPAANEAARIESLTKTTGCRMLVSDYFAR